MELTPAGVPEKFAALGLTFDDVLLLPGESDVIPSQADTCQPHLAQPRGRSTAAVQRDGHRHRGADGDRHGPPRRRRRPAPQPGSSRSRPNRSTS
ncbi:MAG: hypothetical protein WKF83_16790 [Nocardioidaceae bacterium]